MSYQRKGRKPQRKKKTRKRGDAYQDAVGQVAKSLQPSAVVDVGTWIDGPDGRRDLDVAVKATPSSPPDIVIECKDWTRPIGIAFIDALESKRRDIGARVAMICSNSGFTEDALRKAARVGIPVLAALIEGDKRIRVVVRQQIYTRIIQFANPNIAIQYQDLPNEDDARRVSSFNLSDVLCGGRPVAAWMAAECLRLFGLATRGRDVIVRYRFLESPEDFTIRGVQIQVSDIEVRYRFDVQWMTQVAEIGASQGMFDYLRGVVVMGPGQQQFHLKNLNTETWGTAVDIEEVPENVLVPLDQRPKPEVPAMGMELAMMKNLPHTDPAQAPDLLPFLESHEVVETAKASGFILAPDAPEPTPLAATATPSPTPIPEPPKRG